MMADWMFVLQILLLLMSFGQCLRLLNLQVPPVVDVRDKAVLICSFDLEGDELFSVKWYKEELEFFRYMPTALPRVQTFPVDGIHLVESKSNISSVTLSPLEYRSSGVYRCEVSSEAPVFRTVANEANMSVFGLPREDPRINGVQPTYSLGSYVYAKCTSSPSHPPARMEWFINEDRAEPWLLDSYHSEEPGGRFKLATTTISLKFQTDISHFHRKDATLSLTCSAAVGGRTRSTEVRVQLSRLKNEKFAQEYTNHCSWSRSKHVMMLAALVSLLQ